jgi:hypothetical protein
MDVLGSGVGVMAPLISGAILQYFGIVAKSQINGECLNLHVAIIAKIRLNFVLLC